MPTVKVPDLADGPVTIRHAGAEPFTVEAKGGVITCSTEQIPAVLAGFTGAETTSAKKEKTA